MLLSTFFFAVAGPVAKALYSIGWTPGSVVLIRLAGASVLLLVPTLIALRGRWGEVRHHWRKIVTYGVVSMAGVQAFFFLALEHLSVAVAILLEMMGAPLIIVFWLWARTRQRPSTMTGIGVVVSLLGVVLVLDLRNASLNWVGILMALAAAACFASYFLVSSNQTIRLPSIAFTGLGMGIGAFAALIANLTRIMPARFVVADLDFAGLRVPWFVPALLLVLFTVGAYLFGILGLRHLGATVGSFVNLTEVPFSAIAAWILLAEALTPLQLAGGVVILAGIVLVKWGDLKTKPGPPEQRTLSEQRPVTAPCRDARSGV
ncbi:EamA family transporter [Haloechinothrix sp. YIM 98757]|uniref:EamA family transporter n=1 Tax=Haloechinothrix aidingensis TaxID=2752311 RepID=A0A838A9R4_9PSEU|nr:DMT family transporter [Haloechinothrix aidingensis]MBA0125532.1 EamA family transporter [Haloechinothrix aidingensis]